MNKSVMTTVEAARHLGVCPLTLRRWFKKGVGPKYYLTPSGRFLLRRSELEAWIEGRGGQAPERGADEPMAG